MKAKDFDCPSCGASLKPNRNMQTMTCPYCDSTVIIPGAMQNRSRDPWSDRGPAQTETVVLNTQPVQKSCSVAVVAVLVFILGLGAAIFFLVNRSGQVSQVLGGGGVPVVLEFGGEGMGQGYFQNAEHIAVGPGGNIYVAEHAGGLVQIFDEQGNYLDEWNAGKDEDIYITDMEVSRDGIMFLVYDSELYLHDAATGELLGQLEHPDGWGFEDLALGDDGRIAASWYCNRDDIVMFDPQGNLDYVLRGAVSNITGDSELSIQVALDGNGNIFAFGSFNEKVLKFSPSGRYLNMFGSSGDRPGQFTSPSAICTDRMGNLWVSDFGDLIVFDNQGAYIGTVDPGRPIYDMVITGDYQMLAIAADETIVQLDLSEEVEDL